MLDVLIREPMVVFSGLVGIAMLSILFIGLLTRNRIKFINLIHQEQLQRYEQQQADLETEIQQLKRQTQIAHEQSTRQYARIGSLEASEHLLQQQLHNQQVLYSQMQQQEQKHQQRLTELLRERDTLAERYTNQTESLKEKQALLEATEQRLTKEFEHLAHKIFEQKSQAFRQSSELSLENLLKPFREQISGFQQQVHQKNEADTAQQALLQKELEDLKNLNLRMSEEAINLTKALKGENKTQGNWGEVILQRLLAQAGLTEGREYSTQVSLHSEQGKRYQPDVIVHLPQQKDIVIDSKVTLTAYERFCNAEQEGERQNALLEHIQSFRNHIRELSKKNYHELKGIRSLDYVLMFVPIESAFLAAIQAEPELIRIALEQNIMLVSPTNLMVALRTIHNIWQVEQQNRNAQEIADRAGKLYDKFVGFVEDLDKIGASITRANKEFETAKSKLQTGSGNLIRQVTLLQELGVRGNKQLPAELVESAD